MLTWYQEDKARQVVDADEDKRMDLIIDQYRKAFVEADF
jgi:hypothetical protein